MKVICDKKDIVAIADSVRNKTGTTDQMTLEKIKTRIDEIGGTEDLTAELAAQAEVITQLEETVAGKRQQLLFWKHCLLLRMELIRPMMV